MSWLKYLQKPDYWLLGLTVALATLHLTLLDRADQPNLLGVSILFWLAIASLLWDKRHTLKLESDLISTLLGFALISFVLLRGLSPSGYHLRVSPFVTGVGVTLMASGMRGIYQYGKELLILGLLALYSVFESILQAFDLPLITAKISTLLLGIAGQKVEREGVFIGLPAGRVEVYGACSGVESILLMLYIATLFFLLFPIKNSQKILCLGVAVFLGFFVNCVRVAIMALLVASQNQTSFKYWHGDDGSLIFSMIAVFIFGVFCWLVYIRRLSLSGSTND